MLLTSLGRGPACYCSSASPYVALGLEHEGFASITASLLQHLLLCLLNVVIKIVEKPVSLVQSIKIDLFLISKDLPGVLCGPSRSAKMQQSLEQSLGAARETTALEQHCVED